MLIRRISLLKNNVEFVSVYYKFLIQNLPIIFEHRYEFFASSFWQRAPKVTVFWCIGKVPASTNSMKFYDLPIKMPEMWHSPSTRLSRFFCQYAQLVRNFHWWRDFCLQECFIWRQHFWKLIFRSREVKYLEKCFGK